jgi:molybdopterin-guanine dinucleotide biosynthesis protein
MTTLSNWLLISGSGRNVGKTSLICRIIHEMSDLKPVSVKISSHIHPLPEDSEWIIRKEDFAVIRETHINTKDSSKMLQSGAAAAYYAQGPDYRLPEILAALTPFTHDCPVICESGGLRKLIVPGVYLIIKGDDNHTKPGIESLELHADKVLTQADFRTGNFEKHLHYKNNRWIITL